MYVHVYIFEGVSGLGHSYNAITLYPVYNAVKSSIRFVLEKAFQVTFACTSTEL